MTRERTITKIELIQTTVGGHRGWVTAQWKRADGSHGSVTARFRRRTPERWYVATLRIDLPTTSLLRDVPLARIEAAANADPKIRKWMDAATDAETVKRSRAAAARRSKLVRPNGRLDDRFYRQVAAAYRGAIAHGLPPAKTLSEDSDTPQGTVNRWIAQARKRDYLPDGEPGRVTF